MKRLKVCFVGVGSIAKRHMRNLSEICQEKGIELVIDACRRKSSSANEAADFINRTYYSYKEVPKDYNVIFITNPTELHLEALEALQDCAEHFFIEKPVVSLTNKEKILQFQKADKKTYYVACPLRYNAVIQYVKEHININDVIAIRSISSSYLPEWRPGVDYRKTYSAIKAMGGGVSMDLIHEWDYLKYIFGMPEAIVYRCGKKSPLEIDCEDYALYIAEYPKHILELHLDYFGRESVRQLQLFTKEDTILCDILHGKITYMKQHRDISLEQERDMIQKGELYHFLDIIDGKIENDNDIYEAYRTLNLTAGIVEE